VEDAQTGLTYMQQRYFDPLCGCFLSVDPVTAYASGDMRSFARYAYAFNNPYRFTDPDGRNPAAGALAGCAATGPACPAGAAVGFVIGTVVGIGIYYGGKYLHSLFAQNNATADPDPNGQTTNETKTRQSTGSDGATSEHTIERDSEGRTISTTHTVTGQNGEVVHQHQDHIGQSGSVRRFSDELTGTTTVGEPELKDRDVSSGPEQSGGESKDK
jgi:RHS repeat-associated protein